MSDQTIKVTEQYVDVTTDGVTRRYTYIEPAVEPVATTLRPKSGEYHKDIVFDVNGPEGTAAIVVEGGADGVRLENIEQRGNSMGVLFKGCNNVLVQGLEVVSGKTQDKAIYTGGPGENRFITLRDVKVVCPSPADVSLEAKRAAAEHALRFHGWRDILIENADVQYANFLYKGAALTVHEHGENMLIDGSTFFGPVGFGNLPVNYAAREGWELFRVKGVVVQNCMIFTPNWLHAEPGCENLIVRNTTVRAVRWPTAFGAAWDNADLSPYGQVLQLRAPRDPWPCNGRFEGCTFAGTTLMNSSSQNAVDAGHWDFIGCTFNGRQIDRTGRVI
jgi:hypothetical protein